MKYYSSGKLLLTAEYMVLNGATALSLPTRFGQTMNVEASNSQSISWKSFDKNGLVWFENEFDLINFAPIRNVDTEVEKRLTHLFNHIKSHGSINFSKHGYSITTSLEFDKSWGLGSSSTLVANLAKWSGVDGIALLHSAFKGSGYDVATGLENKSIKYTLQDSPSWEQVLFNPPFSDNLYFVYLGQKQNSESEVKRFDSKGVTNSQVKQFTTFTTDMLGCKNLGQFEEILNKHELTLSEILERKTIKELLFSDYSGSIKSLGAWGGDFVLVTGDRNSQEYFRSKGFKTILSWEEMIA